MQSPEDYGIDINSGASIKQSLNNVMAGDNFGSFFGWELGFDKFFREIMFEWAFIPKGDEGKEIQRGEVCSMLYYELFDPRLH